MIYTFKLTRMNGAKKTPYNTLDKFIFMQGYSPSCVNSTERKEFRKKMKQVKG